MKNLFLPALLAACLGSVPAALGQVVYNPFGGEKPSAIPRTINPKRPLTIDVGYPNPLKYKVEVKSVYFTREYSTTQAASTKQDDTAPSADKDTNNDKGGPIPNPVLGNPNPLTLEENAAKAKAAADKIVALTKQYTQYNALTGELGKQYQANTWSDKLFENNIKAYAQAVFPQDYSTISGRDLTTKLQLLKQLLNDALEEYDESSKAIAKEAGELKSKRDEEKNAKNPNPARIRKAEKAYDKAWAIVQNHPAKSKTIEDTLLKEMESRLTGESQVKELNVLGLTYVALRDFNPEGIVIQPSSIPDGKDELDLEVKLILRSDYERPPGIALSEPQPLNATLYVVPRFRITASVGPYFGGLFDSQFSLAEDSLQVNGAPDSGGAATTRYIRRKRIVRENDSQLFDYVGATVLTHFEYRVHPGLSYALSLGAGTQATNFRFLIGPSVLFGNSQRGAITTGLLLGQVKRLSNRYAEGDLVPVALEDVPTREVNKSSWFVSITYNLSSTRK